MTQALVLPERRLYVSWRDPSSGSISPIGVLARRQDVDGDRYSFAYLKVAETLPGFIPLPGLPNLHRRYESPRLFSVFANRVMARSRPEYDALATRVHLSAEADPFEVMARSGGRRATDRIEVFSPPQRSASGGSTCLFFARGIPHIDGAVEAVDGLHPGDELLLVDEPTNGSNLRAVLLHAQDECPVGYAPDYLVDHIHELRQLNGHDPRVVVEHVNDRTSAPHLRLLCRLSAPWPEGYQPFSDAQFQPLVDLA
jgi:hypothetical protein